MDWIEILKYEDIIKRIAIKYSGNRDLAEDVYQEVMLRLYEDKNLDTNKFNPDKKDAAIRNTIRNKALKVLTSKKYGRWPFVSLDSLTEAGFQVDSDRTLIIPQPKNPDKIDDDLQDNAPMYENITDQNDGDTNDTNPSEI